MSGGFRPGRPGEIAVVGLGKSGTAVTRLLRRHGERVYASDAGRSEASDRAAAELRALGADADIGGHDLARIGRASLVVASPGVPPSAPPLAAARAAGVAIVGEIEIALHFLPSMRYIAVTGTNGKTTTTALVGALLRALGHDAPDAGNIGRPLAEVALSARPPAWAALELSSFQLHDTPSVRPTVGVLTNLGPDHLDRYASVDEYYADKERLFANAGRDSHWVVNADDPLAAAMAARHPGARHGFSVTGATVEARWAPGADELELLGTPLMRRADLGLLGDHNVANALAAGLAVAVADAGHRTPEARRRMADALRAFRALKHRLELAGEYGGVQWINDSKATNVGSTLVAIQGMTRPFILLLGGRHKGEPYTTLATPFGRHGKVVLAYGESAPIVEHDLAGLAPVERLGSDFGEVIARARALAAPGDAVLLSPACSSYDMFDNYEHRGAEFRRLAAEGA
jgi:UDP-N-acetylmuramoylalanine--D-glutamate ligase